MALNPLFATGIKTSAALRLSGRHIEALVGPAKKYKSTFAGIQVIEYGDWFRNVYVDPDEMVKYFSPQSKPTKIAIMDTESDRVISLFASEKLFDSLKHKDKEFEVSRTLIPKRYKLIHDLLSTDINNSAYQPYVLQTFVELLE